MEEVVYDARRPAGDRLVHGLLHAARRRPAATSPPHTDESQPCKINPLGAKGVGELGTVGGTPTVINAVIDALRPLGVNHIEMPATPERVWRAIRDARSLSWEEGRLWTRRLALYNVPVTRTSNDRPVDPSMEPSVRELGTRRSTAALALHRWLRPAELAVHETSAAAAVIHLRLLAVPALVRGDGVRCRARTQGRGAAGAAGG